MDITIKKYQKLLTALQQQGASFQTFSEFLQNPQEHSNILRHDVDLLPGNSLRFAQIQAELGIKGSYYFRAVPQSWDEAIIKKIAALGHEVGYHYENMDDVSEKLKVKSLKFKAEVRRQKSGLNLLDSENSGHPLGKGQSRWDKDYEKLLDLAYEDFCENLEKLRKLVPVTTICMHGSPRSIFDNKAIWEKYDYKTLGLIGEPYFNIDFNKVAYLTDTGRRWNGGKVSIRDKVNSSFNFNFRSTKDIINSVDKLPDQVMFTFHPQRWSDNWYLWTKELVLQNIKNQVKRFVVRK